MTSISERDTDQIRGDCKDRFRYPCKRIRESLPLSNGYRKLRS